MTGNLTGMRLVRAAANASLLCLPMWYKILDQIAARGQTKCVAVVLGVL